VTEVSIKAGHKSWPLSWLRRWLPSAAALLLLNLSLSFESLWPTPGIRWAGELSVECAVIVAALAAARGAWGAPSRWALRGLAALWTILVIGRYAAVTSTALFGRDINLYWDSRHLSAVASMLARVASPLEVLGVVLAAVLIPLLVYAVLRWALGRVSGALEYRPVRRSLLGTGVALVVTFAVQQAYPDTIRMPVMPAPITQTYARQAAMVADVVFDRGANALGDGPALTSNLSALGNADILLVFIESYGAVAFDRPEFTRALSDRRSRFEQQIKQRGLGVVSAFVESPTFGGSSWLAHISFLTGFEVKDEGTNVRLMAQKRPTLVSALSGHGYHTVALMPGLQQDWPEGAFYGFDRIYNTEQLQYTGPSFGWWPVPDQFALAQLDHLELAPKERAPVFAFLPTTSTHTPFSPTPPYQPSWTRMLTEHPYDEADYQRAWAEPPDWLNLGPSYVHSIDYAFASLGGFVGLPRNRDVVLILIGDHQPPAVVSGEGAPWDVPVHIVSSRPLVLEALRAHGFRDGMTPPRARLMKMHELMPAVFSAFDAVRVETAAAAQSGS
jgi:hypothetical protein